MSISVDEAALLLKQGKVVAIPTETVYGLAASLSHEAAIEHIFHLKGRSRTNPLIIHVASKEAPLEYMSSLPEGYEALVKAFWPGPLTLVLPIDPVKIPSIVRAGLTTAAFRFPAHPVTQAILHQSGPVVAPSANLSGKPSGTSVEHIQHDFGTEFPVVDGGKIEHGLESTILALDGNLWCCGRRGAIPVENFRDVLGYEPAFLERREKPICPGQHFLHYAPNARLKLTKEPTNTVVVGFSDRSYPQAEKLFLLGSSTSPAEVAQNLYKTLRALDEAKIQSAEVDIDFPEEALWQTIRERLLRASQF